MDDLKPIEHLYPSAGNIYLKIKKLYVTFKVKSITRSLIIFKKPRKMTNDFFNHYIFVHWRTSSECLTNVTITVKVPMVTNIHCENG